MNISSYTVTSYVVASTGVYHGVGMSNSIREALALAEVAKWDALAEGDRIANYCSGIAVEGWEAVQYGRTVASHCDI